jgi:hypothetical protein
MKLGGDAAALSAAPGRSRLPVPASLGEYRHLFVKAAQSLGLPFAADFNVGAPGGVGYLQFQ